MFGLEFDNYWTRRWEAKKIKGLVKQFQDEPQDKILIELEQFTKSKKRFPRCFALRMLGRLGDASRSILPTIILALQDDDPFVRHAASEAILVMAERGNAETLTTITEYSSNLVTVSKDFECESSGLFAAQTLDILNEFNR